MMTHLRKLTVVAATLMLVILSACGSTTSGGGSQKLDIAFLPKAVNIPYFDTAAAGGQKAAGELSGTFKQVGPNNLSAAEQVPFIQTLTTQHISAIVVSADDPSTLVPALKDATAKGIKVVTYDSDTDPAGRSVFVNQATAEGIGRAQMQEMGKEMNYTGEFAILSATATSPNQNAWIGFMKQEQTKSQYANMKLDQIAYATNDQEAYSQTQALLQAFPNLKGIISPVTYGIAAAARYVDTNQLAGKVFVTGLGTPNDMRKFVKDGAVKGFILWNVNNLGYLAYYTAALLVQGKIKGTEGESYTAGSLGKFTIGKNGEVVLGDPLVFDSTNIDQFNF